MARAWFFNIPTHGHISPTLPLVAELVRQGDEITYYAGPRFEEKICATGASYRDYGGDYTFDQSRSVSHAAHQGGQVAEATSALLAPILAAVDKEHPDYILFDMSAPWGSIAAQRNHIPAITSFPHLPFHWRTFFSDPRVFRKGLQSVKPGQGHYRELRRQTSQLARQHHLRKPQELNILSSSAELNIVFSSRYFQPYEESFDDSYCFIGPVIDTDRPDDQLPISRSPGQKLIYIAVGTLYQANIRFFQNCMLAFDDDDYVVVMSVGKTVDPADLESIPDNFVVAQYVPQLSVLAEADLFVTHGGMNSINEAVMALVPMIVVPNTLEQSMNAARLEELSGGIYLEAERLTPASLRTAAEEMLADPQTRSGLEKIRLSFLEAGGIERAAELIQSFKHSYNLD